MLYGFDDYTLDTQERTLVRRGVVIPLTPKVFETLLVLVKNHDHVMSKDDLLSSIWPEAFVEEANLTQNISVLRKALGGADHGRSYIATFSGRGYKFLEPVVVEEHRPAPVSGVSGRAAAVGLFRNASLPQHTSRKRGRRLAYLASSAVALLTAIVLAFIAVHRERPRAVLVPATLDPGWGPTGAIRTAVRMAGAQYQPVWSPDGEQLAFAHSEPDGHTSAIYVQRVGQMHPRDITSGSGEYSSPVFSPDGKSLAFLHTGPNLAEILIYEFDTAKTRRLTTLHPHHYGLNCRQLDWSPNGRFLVVGDKETLSDPLSLYLVFLVDGTKTRLTYPDMDILGDTSPRFSPDGTHVAFIRMKYQYEYDVFMLPVTGGEASRLTHQSSVMGDVDWETNSRIVYSGDQDGEFRLWQVDLRSPNAPLLLASSIATDMPLQFSFFRKAKTIAFCGYRRDLDIWALDLSKSSASAPDWKPVIRTPGQDITPLFSPNGNEIAFRSDVAGKLQIWICRPDGSKATAIPTGTLIPSVISWAPDSQSIVFSSLSAQGIFQVSLSASYPVHKAVDGNVNHPLYSVDGKWIFAAMGNFIYRFPVGGGNSELLTDQGGSPIRQSNDGRYLYFGHGRMETTISRLDLATRQQEVVIRSLIPGYRDAWSLTNHGIMFLTEDAGIPVIEYHDFTTGANRKIAAFPGPLPLIATSGFSVSPDGKTLLVVRTDPASANIQTATFSNSNEVVSPSIQHGQ